MEGYLGNMWLRSINEEVMNLYVDQNIVEVIKVTGLDGCDMCSI